MQDVNEQAAKVVRYLSEQNNVQWFYEFLEEKDLEEKEMKRCWKCGRWIWIWFIQRLVHSGLLCPDADRCWHELCFDNTPVDDDAIPVYGDGPRWDKRYWR
jgi:hypothetical protein